MAPRGLFQWMWTLLRFRIIWTPRSFSRSTSCLFQTCSRAGSAAALRTCSCRPHRTRAARDGQWRFRCSGSNGEIAHSRGPAAERLAAATPLCFLPHLGSPGHGSGSETCNPERGLTRHRAETHFYSSHLNCACANPRATAGACPRGRPPP